MMVSTKFIRSEVAKYLNIHINYIDSMRRDSDAVYARKLILYFISLSQKKVNYSKVGKISGFEYSYSTVKHHIADLLELKRLYKSIRYDMNYLNNLIFNPDITDELYAEISKAPNSEKILNLLKKII